MKKILYFALIISLTTVSCKNRKNANKETTETTKVEEVVEEIEVSETEEAPKEDVIEEADKGDVVVISLSRSVCFGKCPAFSLQFYKDGTVTYEGEDNVKMIGKHRGKVDTKIIDAIMMKADQMGYFKLKDKYDNENVTDLPTSVTYLDYDGKKKKVICRFECDARLLKINNMIEQMTNSIKFEKVEK